MRPDLHPQQEHLKRGETMTQRRLAIVVFVVLILVVMLACQSSTALMTDAEIMNHVVHATPWP
jgi:hypothetical protein